MKIRIHRPLYVKCLLGLAFADFIGYCYRQSVYNHGAINYLGLADYYPNILAVPAVMFLTFGFSSPKGAKEETGVITTLTISLVIYEFLQLLPFFGRVFDWKDILASFLSGGLALFIYQRTNRGTGQKPVSDQIRVP